MSATACFIRNATLDNKPAKLYCAQRPMGLTQYYLAVSDETSTTLYRCDHRGEVRYIVRDFDLVADEAILCHTLDADDAMRSQGYTIHPVVLPKPPPAQRSKLSSIASRLRNGNWPSSSIAIRLGSVMGTIARSHTSSHRTYTGDRDMLRTTKALKPVKLTNNDKATLRLAALIESGRTITVDAAWGYVTVGHYTPAVGPQGFAVYGYRTDNFTGAEFTGPTASAAAARQAVAVCGSTRVFDACRRVK